jgi:HEAT repeat protein
MAQARPQGKPRVVTPGFALEVPPASLLVVIVMLVLFIADGVLMARHLSEIGLKGPAETVGILWLVKMFVLAIFFTLPVPLVMGALWGVAELMRLDLPRGLYVRSAALASLPMSLILLDSMTSAAVPVFKILIFFTFIGTKLILQVPFKQAMIYFLASTPVAVVGIYAGYIMVSPIEHNSERASARAWAQREADQAEREARNSALALSTETITATPTVEDPFADPLPEPPAASQPVAAAPAPAPAPTPTAVAPATPTSQPVTLETRMASLRTQAAALRSRTGRGRSVPSRQTFARELEPLQAELEALKVTRGSTPDWRAIERELRQLVNVRDRLPSDTPPDEIFEPLTAPTTFPGIPAVAADPPRAQIASAWDYNLVLPEKAEVDLRSDEDSPDGIIWTARKDQRLSGLRLKLIDKSDPRQQRPWIVPRGFSPAEASSLLIYKAGDAAAPPSAGNHPSAGMIGGLAFTRIPLDAPGQVEYVASVGNKWLIARVQSGGRPSEIIDFEPALQSLHARAADEPILKPVRAETLASRVAQPPVAAALKKMPDAEEVLLEQYEKMSDPQKSAAIGVLVDVATEKSIPLLDKLQDVNSPQRSAIRQTLSRLAPEKYDILSMAITDLKSNDPRKRSSAVSLLVREERDEKRSDVIRALEAIDDQIRGREITSYAAAIAKWADARTAAKFRPMLDERSQPRRELAMAVLAAMKDRPSIPAIAKLLATDTPRASAALISIGPVAEDEVVKYVRQANPKVRIAAVQILEKIGGQRSLAALNQAANMKDPKDPGAEAAARAAQEAYDAVRARFDAQRAAPPSDDATTRPAPALPPG